MRILVTGGLTLEHGSLVPAQFAVEDGRIVPFPTEISPADRMIDVAGGVVVPGLVDVHVHLREPGFSYKETVLTGTRAAAHGG